MTSRFFKKEAIYTNILVMSVLAVFLKFWEPGLGNSAAGYGSLARNLAEDNLWFHIHMAPDFFNPFAEHPYLVIWLDAIIFRLFGASAQTIRLLSSLAGVAIFSSIFLTARRFFGERVAVFATLSLLLVNVFMNYTSSGWLDMPMVGFVWGGVYFGFKGLQEQNEKKGFFLLLLGGLFCGLAVLAKGVCALGIFGTLFFIFCHLYREKKIKTVFWICAFVVAPVVVFTVVHFYAEGFFFWKKYLLREAIAQTLDNPRPLDFMDYTWYFRSAFQYGHLVTALGISGAVLMWRDDKKDWALLILFQLLVHALGYSWSTRHYSQYTLPIFPWLAIGCGYTISKIFRGWSALDASIIGARGVLLVFVVFDIFPIRVHSGNENPFRSFMPTLQQMKDNRHMYFVGDYADQSTWEDPVSYIVWYWHRIPYLVNFEGLLNTIETEDKEALGVVSTELYKKDPELVSKYKHVQVCMYNDLITLLSQPALCDEDIKTWRLRESAKTFYKRTP